MKDEALRLALEALKEIIHWYAVRDRNDVLLNFVDQNPEIKKAMKAITSVEAALEAKYEPDYKALWQQMCERCDELDKKLAQQEHGWTPERIAGMARLKAQQDKRLEPQRTWVGLTDEDVDLIANKHATLQGAIWSIEARLKEKNT